MISSKVLLVVLVGVLFSKYVENCKPTQNTYFPGTPASAVAVLKGFLNGSKIVGTVSFSQISFGDLLKVNVNITGLPAGQGSLKHGLHVHATGITSTSDNVTAICGSAGPHFNPLNVAHGDISAATRHVGDYGNIVSDNDGNIIASFTDSVSQLYGAFGIVGRTIVLHQDQDDLGLVNNTASQTTGNSGARVACGIIGLTAN